MYRTRELQLAQQQLEQHARSFDAKLPGKHTLTEALNRPDPRRADNDNDELARQVAALPPDQRSYYEELVAQLPEPTRKACEDALETAKTSRVLSGEDRAAVRAAQEKLASMKATPIDDKKNPNQVQIEVTFDGTWNDRDKMDFDTNPALINELFEGTKDYQVGVGTGSILDKLIGGTTGNGVQNRIDRAYANLVKQINQIKSSNRQAEIVLIVTGFSRGATAARAFTNELNRRGVPDLSSRLPDGTYARKFEGPRIGVLVLFDTVGSVGVPGDEDNSGHDLSVPANAENVLHLTARDEKRTFFPLTSAVDQARPDDPRITELELPGAHSDVGGSYANPYSRIPLQMAHQYMKQRGVHVRDLDPASIIDPDDPRLRLHDSGAPYWGDTRTVFPSPAGQAPNGRAGDS
jgi:hypothetical protein